jgi:uncharacterized damage-inducible protein DinB
MKEILLEQFNAGYEENGWFVALKNALANMTAEQALWKPQGTEHSVWEMVYHLWFWNDRWRRRYLNEPQETKGPIVISETFQAKENAGEADWQAAVEKLFAVMDFWKETLADITEEKLNEPVSERNTDAWFYPLANMMVHNAYHIGQIVIIRKIAGNWDAAKGVS